MTRGAEGAGHASRLHLALNGQRGKHLADRAVGADGEQAFARAFDAGCNGKSAVGKARIYEASALCAGAVGQAGDGAKARVQATGEVVAEVDGLQEGLTPEVRDGAAAIGDADDEGTGTGGAGFGEGLVGQSEVGVAVGKAELANALFGPPLGDANGRFGG